MTNWALAVEWLLGPADYGSAETYEDLQRTWRDARPLPSDTDLADADIERLAALEAAEQAAAEQAAAEATLRETILATASSAEGVSVGALSPEQQAALLIALAFKLGAVGTDLTVQPLEAWLPS